MARDDYRTACLVTGARLDVSVRFFVALSSRIEEYEAGRDPNLFSVLILCAAQKVRKI